MWTTTIPNNYYTTLSAPWVEQMRQYVDIRQQQEMAQRAAMRWDGQSLSFGDGLVGLPQQSIANPENTLLLIKKTIREINAEAVDEKAQAKVRSKIERLQKLGVTAQAAVLELELQVRVKLMRVQEWDYKVLLYDAIEAYNHKVVNSYYMKVHIDPLDKYCGTTTEAEAKDKIIPDAVLDDLQKAKERQVFDGFSVLWVEKVKDPLLLGSINGCKDYFLIAEWGEDVSFEQIMKGK